MLLLYYSIIVFSFPEGKFLRFFTKKKLPFFIFDFDKPDEKTIIRIDFEKGWVRQRYREEEE